MKRKKIEDLENSGTSGKTKDVLEGNLTNESIIDILTIPEEQIKGMSEEEIVEPLLQMIEELLPEFDGEMKEIALEIQKEGKNIRNNKGLLERITTFMNKMHEIEIKDELSRILSK